MTEPSIPRGYTPLGIPMPSAPLPTAAPDLGLPPGLGPDGILLVLGDRVRDLDGQIGLFQRAISQRTERAKAVQALLSDLQQLATEAGGQTNGDWNLEHCPDGGVPAAYDRIHRLQAAARALGLDFDRSFPVKNRADITDATEQSEVTVPWSTDASGAPTGGGVITKETIQGLIQNVQGELSATNSGNEMDMIFLQSAMQTRSSQIQLVTNLMNEMHQTDQQVIGNIK